MLDYLPFKQVWVIDTEFARLPGSMPDHVCCVAGQELRSGRIVRQWTADGGPVPYDTGPSSLFIAHYSPAEWISHLALGWPVPFNIIDTYAESRALQNGLESGKDGLLMAASRYGIATISIAAKDAGRQLALKGAPWSDGEQQQLLDYCWSDVATNVELFKCMLPEILAKKFGLAHALIRGRYMRSTAFIERNGIPVGIEHLERP